MSKYTTFSATYTRRARFTVLSLLVLRMYHAKNSKQNSKLVCGARVWMSMPI